jgi:hypothetical protein
MTGVDRRSFVAAARRLDGRAVHEGGLHGVFPACPHRFVIGHLQDRRNRVSSLDQVLLIVMNASST